MSIFVLRAFCNKQKNAAIGQAGNFPVKLKLKVAGKSFISYYISATFSFITSPFWYMQLQGILINFPCRAYAFFAIGMPSFQAFPIKQQLPAFLFLLGR